MIKKPTPTLMYSNIIIVHQNRPTYAQHFDVGLSGYMEILKKILCCSHQVFIKNGNACCLLLVL